MPEPTLGPETARAKVNLFLHVLGRRPDGYHLLDSLAVFPAIGDTLHASEADGLTLEVTGPFAQGLATADNLVLRAARRLQEAARITVGAQLTLKKRLPVASGIGGGSADAAATLRLLARLWRTDLPQPALAALALELGADVPVCLASLPARMGGVGELVGTAPALPEAGIVLVNPQEPVATADVFRARSGPWASPAELPPAWPDPQAMAATLATLANDLEAPAAALCPVIARVLAWLRKQPGVLLARMSGSGATCFALCPDPAAAARLAAAAPPPWWAWGGPLDR